MSDMIEAALSYIEQGYRVFPIKPDKKPLTPNGLKDATQTHLGIRDYWTRWPDAGIALVTDGLMVLDFDAKNGGLKSKAAMETKYGSLPSTRTHRTGVAVSTGFIEIPTVLMSEIPLHSPDTRAST